MHSRIIQLETAPIEDVGEICVDDFYDHWFTWSVADYVDEDPDSDGTLSSLMEIFSSCADYIEPFEDEEGKGVIFKEGFVEAYFSGEYAAFEDALNKLAAKTTRENYCKDAINMEMLMLNDAYEDKYGFYISSTCLGLKTLSRFLRYVEPGKRYYFGSTLDYHF